MIASLLLATLSIIPQPREVAEFGSFIWSEYTWASSRRA